MIRSAIFLATTAVPLWAGTILVTSLPDAARPLAPVASEDGLALEAGTEIRIGAFPGLSDDAILDLGKGGGFAEIDAAFVPFGAVCQVGDGVEGQAGSFEISVRQAVAADSPVVGEEISVLIRKGSGQEYLVARFKDMPFEADPDTGLEPLVSLHLAEAKVIAGDRYGFSRISTSPPTVVGSFSEWMKRFTDFDDEERLAAADPDGDGRVNFMEYVLGGDPGSAAGEQGCRLVADGAGNFRVQFSRTTGVGEGPVVEWSPDLVTPWVALDQAPVLEPWIPADDGVLWWSVPVPESAVARGFFRLRSRLGE